MQLGGVFAWFIARWPSRVAMQPLEPIKAGARSRTTASAGVLGRMRLSPADRRDPMSLDDSIGRAACGA